MGCHFGNGGLRRCSAAAKLRATHHMPDHIIEAGTHAPAKWLRSGLVLARAKNGPGSHVVGDPCVVWDETIGGWRMVLFLSPPGGGQAVTARREATGPGGWKLEGALPFTNPGAILGGNTHKPFIVMDAYHPNQAARIEGRYCLLTVSYKGGSKVVQRCWAEKLAGPWSVEEGACIDTGCAGAFDERHVDAVSGFHFPERGETLYFYMGYPQKPQAGRTISPLGNAQAVALGKGTAKPEKLGPILPPSEVEGHWASGWVGGLQLLPGKGFRWMAVVNASPTPPVAKDKTVAREEPAPSLGGFAFCDEEMPVRGWKWTAQPIEWVKDIPADALADGEGTNLWRQHLLALPDGRLALYYNSGFYGKEQLYMKVTAAPFLALGAAHGRSVA